MLGLSARRRRQPSLTIPLILTALVVAYLPFAWDAARDWQGGWWALGVANNAPGRFIRPDEALPRLLTWLGHLSQALGGPLIPAIAGIGSATLLLRAGRNPREHDARSDLIRSTAWAGCSSTGCWRSIRMNATSTPFSR